MNTLPAAEPGTPDDRSSTRYLGWLIRRTWLPVGAAILFAIVWMVCQALVPAVVGKSQADATTALTAAGLMFGGRFAAGAGLLPPEAAAFALPAPFSPRA